jgi:hypothetical protein
MGVAPMRFCVTIWEEFTVKINITPCAPCLPVGRLLEIGLDDGNQFTP